MLSNKINNDKIINVQQAFILKCSYFQIMYKCTEYNAKIFDSQLNTIHKYFCTCQDFIQPVTALYGKELYETDNFAF